MEGFEIDEMLLSEVLEQLGRAYKRGEINTVTPRAERFLDVLSDAAGRLDREVHRSQEVPGANPAERRARLHLSLVGRS